MSNDKPDSRNIGGIKETIPSSKKEAQANDVNRGKNIDPETVESSTSNPQMDSSVAENKKNTKENTSTNNNISGKKNTIVQSQNIKNLTINEIRKIGDNFVIEDIESDQFERVGKYIFDQDITDEYLKKIYSHNILIINCADEDILYYAGLTLMNQMKDKGLAKKIVYEISGNKFKLSSLHDALRSDYENCVFLVEEENGEDELPDLLRSFFKPTARKFQGNFSKKNLFLIYLVSLSNPNKFIEQVSSQHCHFSYWLLDFLPFLLRNRYNKQEAAKIEVQIREQRADGFWPGRDNPKGFRDEVYVIDDLKKQIQLIVEGEIVEYKIGELIHQHKPINRLILYIATFFPNIRVTDFFLLLETLLKATTILPEMLEALGYSGHKKEDQIELLSLNKIWLEKSDSILVDCKLFIETKPNLEKVIRFSKGNLRKELLEEFENRHPLFLGLKSKKIIDSGILLEESISKELVDKLLRYVARTIASESSNYANEIFYQFISKTSELDREITEVKWLKATADTKRIKKSPEKGQDEQAKKQEESNNRIVKDDDENEKKADTDESKIEDERLENWALIRFKILLTEVSKNSKLNQRSNISRFLKELYSRPYQHDILLRLIVELYESATFNVKKWLKELLNHDIKETRAKCLSALLKIVSDSPEKIFEIFEMLYQWHPDETVDYDDYSHLHNYSLIFIYIFLTSEYEKIENEEYEIGSIPSDYPLFSSLAIDGISKIIIWIFNPYLKYAILNITEIPPEKNVLGEIDIQMLGDLQAKAIASWFWVLEGPEEVVDSTATNFSKLLIQEIHQHASQKQLKYIYAWWGVMVKNINQEIINHKSKISLGLKKDNEISSLKAKRDFLYQLKRRFMDASPNE